MSRKVTKHELETFLKQGKRRKAIAKYYRVTVRTVANYIKKYGLVGTARQGRPPKPKKPHKIYIKRKGKVWISVEAYIAKLNEEYHFVNIQYPPYHYVNQRTFVCSNQTRNPRGTHSTVGIYFIVYVSSVYFLYATKIRYKLVAFKEIYDWIAANVQAILEESFPHYYIVGIVGYTFSRPKKKPRSSDMDKQVIIPKYLQEAINPLERGYPKKIKLLVFDVETENGKPYFLIFNNGEKVSYLRVTPDNILDIFMKYLIEQTVKNQCNILLAHNLQFDLFAVLCKREREIAKYRNPLHPWFILLEHSPKLFT